jgi:hypothetical protein
LRIIRTVILSPVMTRALHAADHGGILRHQEYDRAAFARLDSERAVHS